jgi:hypothetical protein
MRAILFVLVAAGVSSPSFADDAQQASPRLRAVWEKNYLTISGENLPGPIRVNYLEAYCRAGSTDRDWGETVIKHQAELVSVSDDGRLIRLRDTLADGVVVEHTLTVRDDEIDFALAAHNPTAKTSEAHWAQPCIRVDEFTGCGKEDARILVPAYARKCFLFIDGKLARLPTAPWATEARYTPGQVYCPKQVDRDDVNPRPLSDLVPSSGLCGCYSADDRWIMATAFEPYQEIFQGVIACMHNDFRIGGLAPGETKKIRGKIYVVPNDMDALVKRFHRDFPEQAAE